jgi:hypothetical protein
MSIAFDNSAKSSYGGSVTSQTITAYVATTNNPYVVVGVILGAATDLVTSVPFNGVNMTQLNKTAGSGGSMLYLYGIAAGGTHDIVVNCSSATGIQILVVSFSGVNQSTPTDGAAVVNTGTSTDANATITTTIDNDWTISVVTDSSGGTTFTAGAGTTQRQTDVSNFPTNIGDSSGPITPAGSTTMHWTKGSSQAWKMIIAALQPAPVSIGNEVFGLVSQPTSAHFPSIVSY